ncbi:MAG: DUF7002 family protein [Gemmatimonadaceae bacterium]
MAVDIEHFARLRPYAYHVTARANLVALCRTRTLEPAATLMRRANRTDLLRWRRPESVTLTVGTETVVLTDQAALLETNLALHRGWSFGDFVEYLNEHVFFWPGTAEGPIKSGLRVHERAEQGSPTLLRIPTAELFDANPTAIPLFCPFNSGAPRQQPGRRVLRGPHLFTVAADFRRHERDVVELAFRSRVSLPAVTAVRQGVEWMLLSSVDA